MEEVTGEGWYTGGQLCAGDTQGPLAGEMGPGGGSLAKGR